MQEAVARAVKGHAHKREVVEFKKDLEANTEALFLALTNGTWRTLIRYRELEKTNNNGKRRHIYEPSFETRVLQHYFLLQAVPLYMKAETGMARNCIPDRGITARRREHGVLREVKHLFYDLREYRYVLVMDQRQCYAHIRARVFRTAMKYMYERLGLAYDRELTDFGTAVSFTPDGRLPIGTPTSPWVHHIVMLRSDVFIKENTEWALRYADDNIMAFRDTGELNAMKWRVQNLWWYVYGIRAKRWATKIVDMGRSGMDFCAYICHRAEGKGVTAHGKGYATVRRYTLRKAKKCSGKGWPSYFGILKEADCFAILVKIQEMKAQELVAKVRIDRDMDARNITVKELADNHIVHTVYDYKILKDTKGNPNWIKCIIGIPEVDAETGEQTGREEAREYHGNLQGIIRWICKLEREFGGRAFMPIEDGDIVNQCGYIYRGSTNQMEYITDDRQ